MSKGRQKYFFSSCISFWLVFFLIYFFSLLLEKLRDLTYFSHDWIDFCFSFDFLKASDVIYSSWEITLRPLCVHTKSLQSCMTPWVLVDCSLPGSSVHGILQARILEWVAIPFSRGSSPPRDWTCVSCISYIAGIFFTTESPGKRNKFKNLLKKKKEEEEGWVESNIGS